LDKVYDILDKIAMGGFSKVFRGIDVKMNQIRAIKVVERKYHNQKVS